MASRRYPKSLGLRAVLLVVSLALLGGILRADEAQIDFVRDVEPIFRQHCDSCHGSEKREGGFRLDRRSVALRGGDNYSPTIVPGHADESPLFQFIADASADLEMPPDGPRLSAEEIDVIRRWIDQGATWPDDHAGEQVPIDHWAFAAIKPAPIPEAPATDSSENFVDRFIRARLAERQLTHSGPAEPATLVRRLWIDLVGLPPMPEESASFLADHRPDAYDRLVDRLLSSPRFGERWARPWLDAVRFTESNGFEMNQIRPNAWPYRDYVVNAFNEDRPYDRFIREQLAGDLLGEDVATGFLVAGPWDQVKSPDPVLTAQQRADELHDMVSTTGSAMLGLTVGCARCHSHKFDPIPQADYYSLKAVFEGVQHGERPRSPEVDPQREQTRLDAIAQLDAIDHEIRQQSPIARTESADAPTRPPVHTGANIDRFEPIPARFVRMTVHETTDVAPCIDEFEIYSADGAPRNLALARLGVKTSASSSLPNSDIHKLEHINDGKFGNSRSWISNEPGQGWVQFELSEEALVDTVVWSRDRTEPPKFQDRLATRYSLEVSTDGETWTLVATDGDRIPRSKENPKDLLASVDPMTADRLARRTEIARRLAEVSKPAMVYAGTFVEPPVTNRFHRGDPMQPREPIAPGSLSEIGSSLSMSAEVPESKRRLELANWIASPENPLTPRVIVNRLWQQHFGQGIVMTPSDFGSAGSQPSHPELLDALAAELISEDWSLKHIHRLLVSSAAYRQSSEIRESAQRSDAGNRLLWRFSSRRIDAEMIRDAILRASGNLDLAMGGPGFDLFEPNDNYVKVYVSKSSFGPADWRRMIYQAKPRMRLDDTFGVFDLPDGGQVMPKRPRSNTPLQALSLLNSGFLVEQSQILADRLERESSQDIRQQVERGFELTLGRKPTEDEARAAQRLVEQHGLPALCRALFNANEFVMLF